MNSFDPPHPVTVGSGVEEIQGLYGPFSFPEKLLQKIWSQGAFDRTAARLIDQRLLRVLYTGKWNGLGGPDFKGARLRFDNCERTGDVELHLQASDWTAHGHPDDPAYDAVILHVVLFPPPANYRTLDRHGRPIPTLVMLPLLLHDLEEYAAAEAVETLANRPGRRAIEELGRLGPEELRRLVHRHAQARWSQKVHFARLRIQRLGWVEACHHVALEILGYRYNRVPMLRVAARLPQPIWATEEGIPDQAYAAEGGWSLQGTRPANYPKLRLLQYSRWQRQRPEWPRLLACECSGFTAAAVDFALTTSEFRKIHQLSSARKHLVSRVCADQIEGTRFDNLVCDGFLPLIAASDGADLIATWFHWFSGDQPPHVAQSLRELGLIGGRGNPACHGNSQGFFGWILEKESKAAGVSTKAVS